MMREAERNNRKRVQEFTEKHGFRQPGLDGCGDYNLQGKRGQIYAYGVTTFGVMVVGDSGHYWEKWRRKFLAAGIRVVQNGDWEGAAVFDPDNESQAKLALEAIQATRKRVLSSEHLAILARTGFKRPSSVRKTQIATPDVSQVPLERK